MHEAESLVQDLLKAGARGYVLKSDAKQHLIAAIEFSSRPQAVLYTQSL